MASILDVIVYLQAIHADVAGVEFAPPDMEQYEQGAISRENFPLVQTMPMDATYQTRGRGVSCFDEIRTYKVVCLVGDEQMGLPMELEREATDILSDFVSGYATSNGRLGQSADQTTIVLDSISDTGVIQNMLWFDTPYIGFEITLDVRRRLA